MPSSRPSAEPITAVIAERVRVLRDQAGLSQAQLAERMTTQGSPWTRSTVVNLETRAAGSRGRGTGRDVVTAQEVLRLAIVLDVPPVWLLADPEDTQTEIPVSNDVAVDPWTAILWISGRQPLGEPSPRWSAAAQPMTWAWQAATIGTEIAERLRFRRIGFQHTIVDDDGQHDQQDAEAAAQTDRRSLERLAPLLDAISKGGYTAPPLPESVITRARELGVDLPGRRD